MKIAFDKKLHFIVSLIIAIVASTAAANFIYALPIGGAGRRTATAYTVALLVTLAVGVAKELRDSRQPGNHFCRGDLMADLLGAAVGSLGAFVSYLL